MSDTLNRKQEALRAKLAKVLDKCHEAGLVLNVMDGVVHVATENRHTSWGLDRENQHAVHTKIEADGGGW